MAEHVQQIYEKWICLQFVTSRKGYKQLLHKGYYYVRERKIGNKVYWRCTQYTTELKCHGRIHTEDNNIVHKSLHNHSTVRNDCTAFFGTTRNNKKMLLIGDHRFIMDHKLHANMNWHCSRYKSSKCKARATTTVVGGVNLFFAILLGEFFHAIEHVTGQRGSRKMICNGHSYICAKFKKGRKYWVCAKQRSKNCKARLITDTAVEEFCVRYAVHNHAPDPKLQHICWDENKII